MNATVGWILAVLLIAAGYVGWGWRGVVLGVTVAVFGLLLQFNRSLRVLRNASGAPVGQVDSALMLHSKLHAGMTMLQVLTLTRSLGSNLGDAPERWGWADAGGARVVLLFERGKLRSWELTRDDAQDAAAAAPEN